MNVEWGDEQVAEEVEADETRAVPRSRCGNRFRNFVIVLLAAGVVFAVGWLLGNRSFDDDPPQGVLPGEFERHEALLLAWDSDLSPPQYDVLVDIVEATYREIELIVLVPNELTKSRSAEALRRASIPADRVRLIELPFQRPWPRDYGPRVLKSFDGDHVIVGADYHLQPDDKIPAALGGLWNMNTRHVPLLLDGGNLLANGTGLCVTTERLVEDNQQHSRSEITALLRNFYGATEVIYLEPLAGEPTGHVDMFATFTSPDCVLVGQYDPRQDPTNAAILDRNAERLSQVTTASGPLRVRRIPMPRRAGEMWYTYTNVVYVNGTLLFPSYPGVEFREEALATFRKALAGWRIVEVDCSSLLESQGALHCATANLFRISR